MIKKVIISILIPENKLFFWSYWDAFRISLSLWGGGKPFGYWDVWKWILLKLGFPECYRAYQLRESGGIIRALLERALPLSPWNDPGCGNETSLRIFWTLYCSPWFFGQFPLQDLRHERGEPSFSEHGAQKCLLNEWADEHWMNEQTKINIFSYFSLNNNKLCFCLPSCSISFQSLPPTQLQASAVSASRGPILLQPGEQQRAQPSGNGAGMIMSRVAPTSGARALCLYLIRLSLFQEKEEAMSWWNRVWRGTGPPRRNL